MLAVALLALAALGSLALDAALPDSGRLLPDSATQRTPYPGIKPYLVVDEEYNRDAWQLPDQLVDSLRILPGQRIADIGAGIGYFEALLARAVGDSGVVFAQEIEAELVQYMKERAIREGTPQVRPILGTPTDSCLPDSLDLVFLCNTYRYIDGRRSYFAKLRDHLRPDGRLVVVEFKRFPRDTTELRILPSRVIDELRVAGYELIDKHDFLPKQYFLEFRPDSAPRLGADE
jgi:SAM-dependent methyltransferase